MALTGIHVHCGYSNPTFNAQGQQLVTLRGRSIWSQTMSSPGTTTNSAGAVTSSEGEPIFSIDTSVDMFFSIGPTPDPTSGVRRFLKSGDSTDISVAPGDKLAWTTA